MGSLADIGVARGPFFFANTFRIHLIIRCCTMVNKYKIYDIVHRSLVAVLAGSTVIMGTYLLYDIGYRHMFVRRPEMRRKHKEQQAIELEAQQTERESELMMQQQEAEKMTY